MYKTFAEYDYNEDIYRIMGRSRQPKKPKPEAIYLDNVEMRLLMELISWGVSVLELKDEDFINLYKKMHMINMTYGCYTFISIQNHMDEQGILRNE